MGLNDTPSGERIHIGFFGRRNAGKSSVVNAVTGQDLAVVSDTLGTTTDPVMKAMELLPMGPVMIIDTPGFDDEGTLGMQRVQKAKQILNRADVAVLVVDATEGMKECDEQLLTIFQEKMIPYIVAYNKCDLIENVPENTEHENYISALDMTGINELKERIAELGRDSEEEKLLVSDLVNNGDFIVLVIPIDEAAPKGRLILPQQQVIRDLLESGAPAICVQVSELAQTLEELGKKPAMVITDSQAFKEVAQIVPEDIALTSFSILLARHKGLLETAVRGVTAVEKLKDGDRILISEGCTHHRQCNDIGTVKIPRWLKKYTGKELQIETSSGRGFPEDLSPYAMIIHCGGCMLNEREVRYRMKCAEDQNVPITNYGITIAYMQGILERSIGIFPALKKEYEETIRG